MLTFGTHNYDTDATETAEPMIIKPLPEQGNGLCSATMKSLGETVRHWQSTHVLIAFYWLL